MVYPAMSGLDRTRAQLFTSMLLFIRVAAAMTLLLGILTQLLPLLRTPAIQLMLGVAAADLLMAAAAGYLVERQRLDLAMLVFSVTTIALTAISAVILRFPPVYMGAVVLVIVISAFINGPAAALVPALVGLVVFIGVAVVADLPWAQGLMLALDPGVELAVQIFFTLIVFGFAAAICALLAGQLERSSSENQQRAAEAEQARAEQAALAEQLGREVQEQQALIAVVQQLEVPVIVLAERVLALPLVGNLDSRRFDQIERRLLDRLAIERVDLVLTDLTAVATVDTAVAARLLRMGQTVRLLGVEMALTGIRPAVAQTIISLGIDSLGMRSYANMQDAISAQMLDSLRNG